MTYSDTGQVHVRNAPLQRYLMPARFIVTVCFMPHEPVCLANELLMRTNVKCMECAQHVFARCNIEKMHTICWVYFHLSIKTFACIVCHVSVCCERSVHSTSLIWRRSLENGWK